MWPPCGAILLSWRDLEAGFDHHLIKPADFGELKRLLTERARLIRGAGA